MFNMYDLRKYTKNADELHKYIRQRMTPKTKQMKVRSCFNGKEKFSLLKVPHYSLDFCIKEAKQVILKNRNGRVNIAIWTEIIDALERMKNERDN